MIAKIFEGIARTINKRPLLVAVLVFALFCVAIYGTTQLTMQTGWETYLDKTSEKGVIYSEYQDNFPSDSTIILIIESSDPLNPAILSYIDDLETDLLQQQNIKGTQSIVDVKQPYPRPGPAPGRPVYQCPGIDHGQRGIGRGQRSKAAGGDGGDLRFACVFPADVGGAAE
jgi:predicted RND superfamily exporter protein